MQMGSVGAYQPDAPINDTRAVTMDASVSDSLIPSLAPFAPEPVAVVVEAPTNWGLWATLGGLTLFAWLMMSPRRR